MTYIRLTILLALLVFALGCSKSMTIVKARPKNTTYTSTPAPWQQSYNTGLAHYKKKQYAKAMQFYLTALEQSGNDDDTRGWMYYSIGLCWEGLNDNAKAKQNYIMAQNLDPNLTEAAEGIARIAKQMAEKN